MQMVEFVGLMSCTAKSSHVVALQDMCLAWEEKLQKDLVRDSSTKGGLLYPAANPIIKSQAGELHLNCSHAEAAARRCLAMPAGPYTVAEMEPRLETLPHGFIKHLRPAVLLSWVGQGSSGSPTVLSLQSLQTQNSLSLYLSVTKLNSILHVLFPKLYLFQPAQQQQPVLLPVAGAGAQRGEVSQWVCLTADGVTDCDTWSCCALGRVARVAPYSGM